MNAKSKAVLDSLGKLFTLVDECETPFGRLMALWALMAFQTVLWAFCTILLPFWLLIEGVKRIVR